MKTKNYEGLERFYQGAHGCAYPRRESAALGLWRLYKGVLLCVAVALWACVAIALSGRVSPFLQEDAPAINYSMVIVFSILAILTTGVAALFYSFKPFHKNGRNWRRILRALRPVRSYAWKTASVNELDGLLAEAMNELGQKVIYWEQDKDSSPWKWLIADRMRRHRRAQLNELHSVTKSLLGRRVDKLFRFFDGKGRVFCPS